MNISDNNINEITLSTQRVTNALHETLALIDTLREIEQSNFVICSLTEIAAIYLKKIIKKITKCTKLLEK